MGRGLNREKSAEPPERPLRAGRAAGAARFKRGTALRSHAESRAARPAAVGGEGRALGPPKALRRRAREGAGIGGRLRALVRCPRSAVTGIARSSPGTERKGLLCSHVREVAKLHRLSLGICERLMTGPRFLSS